VTGSVPNQVLQLCVEVTPTIPPTCQRSDRWSGQGHHLPLLSEWKLGFYLRTLCGI